MKKFDEWLYNDKSKDNFVYIVIPKNEINYYVHKNYLEFISNKVSILLSEYKKISDKYIVSVEPNGDTNCLIKIELEYWRI